MQTNKQTTALSTGQIARRIGHSRDRVRYVIARDGFEPLLRVGMNRAFDVSVLPAIKTACDRLARDRGELVLAI